MALLDHKALKRVLAGSLLLAAFAVVATLLFKATADPQTVYELALAAVEAGRLDEAASALDQLKTLREPTVLDRGLRARVAIGKSQDNAAVELLKTIPLDHELAGWSRLRIGQIERKASRFVAAETALREAIQLDPERVEARRELIYILGLQLRRRELNEQFREVSQRSTLTPKEVWVWCMVRDLAWWSPGEHAPMLKKAIEADPGDTHSILALAEVERRQGHHSEARQWLSRNPADDPETLAALAEIAFEEQGPTKAEEVLQHSQAKDQGAFDSLRGRIALAARDGKTAIAALTRALAREPGRRGLVADLGKAWVVAGEPEKGREFVALAAKIDKLNTLLLQSENQFTRPDPARWRLLAEACEAADRPHEARAWLTLLVGLDPLDTKAQTALFRVREQIERQGRH